MLYVFPSLIYKYDKLIVKRSPKYTSRRNQTIEVTKNKYKPLPVKYQDNSLNISVNSRHYF